MSLWLYDPYRVDVPRPRPRRQVQRYQDPFLSLLTEPLDILDSFLDTGNQVQVRGNPGKLSVDRDGNFSYAVDTSGFHPDEIKVNLEGNEVVVSGEHSENRNNESVHRSFVRRVALPEDSNLETLKCDLEGSNRLLISGVRKILPGVQKRSIPINIVPTDGNASVQQQSATTPAQKN